MTADLVALRRAMHHEPEVGLDLPLTQEKILDAVRDLPLEISVGKSLSSVTAVLRGNETGQTVLLRADMDALPVNETANVPFTSGIPGAMHACGHDLHVAMLVGAARILCEHKMELAGDVIFMFQPGEEAGYNGAGKMLDEGLLDAAGTVPSEAFALHVQSSHWARGTMATRPGVMMAAADGVFVTVKGKGGHASAPQLAADPLPAVCQMILALNGLTRNAAAPTDPCVITVGSLHSGELRNVIPETASFEATVRTVSDITREALHKAIERTCMSIAAAYGVEVIIDRRREYTPLRNNSGAVAHAKKVFKERFPTYTVETMASPVMGSEDFSLIADRVPAAMLFLGAPPDNYDAGSAPYNHAPDAEFDESIIPEGAALLASIAMDRPELSPVAGGEAAACDSEVGSVEAMKYG